MNLRLLTALSGLILTSGCASITAGTTQSVAVDTSPTQGAECQLTNEKGAWTIPRTPGSTTVNKAYGPLTVTCRTQDGASGSASVVSTTAGAAFGNIIAGGIIGAAVDMSSGAAYQYPPQVLVPLVPISAPQPQPVPAPAAGQPPATPASGRKSTPTS